MLSNPSFMNKAPKEKVDQEKKKQEEYRLQYNDVLKALKEIEKSNDSILDLKFQK